MRLLPGPSIFFKNEINAPATGSVKHEEEKREAIHRRHFTAIRDREETATSRKHKICDGHFTAGEKRAKPGEEAQRYGKPAD